MSWNNKKEYNCMFA